MCQQCSAKATFFAGITLQRRGTSASGKVGFFDLEKNHSCVLKNQFLKTHGAKKKPASFKNPYSAKLLKSSASYRG